MRLSLCYLFFPLLCVTKPYSTSYVQQILSRSRRFPWFYPDDRRGGDWYVYDSTLVPTGARQTPPRTRRPTPGLGKPDQELTQALGELGSDPQAMRVLQEAASRYSSLLGRDQVLVLRAHAHERIRNLLSHEALPALTLDAFNNQVWQSGLFLLNHPPLEAIYPGPWPGSYAAASAGR